MLFIYLFLPMWMCGCVDAVKVDVSLAEFQMAHGVTVAGKRLDNVWKGESSMAAEGGRVCETGELRGVDLPARSIAVFVGAWYKEETVSFQTGLLFGKRAK